MGLRSKKGVTIGLAIAAVAAAGMALTQQLRKAERGTPTEGDRPSARALPSAPKSLPWPEPPLDTPRPVEPCAKQVAKLREWVRVIAEEGDVFPEIVPFPDDKVRFFGRPLPRLPLLRMEAAASPIPQAALVSLHESVVRFRDTFAPVWNEPAVNGLMTHAAAAHPGVGFGRVGVSYNVHPVVLLIGENERWSEIVTVVESAARVQFAQVYFTVAVKSASVAPRATRVRFRMLELATDRDVMPYKRDFALAEELERQNPRCPLGLEALKAASGNSVDSDRARRAFFGRVADAVAACECAADLDAIEAFTWARLGRHWGELTASYDVELAPRDRGQDPSGREAEEFAAPAAATWREVAGRVIELAKLKRRFYFAAR